MPIFSTMQGPFAIEVHCLNDMFLQGEDNRCSGNKPLQTCGLKITSYAANAPYVLMIHKLKVAIDIKKSRGTKKNDSSYQQLKDNCF